MWVVKGESRLYPDLFSIGPVTIHSFGTMLSLAFLVSGAVAAWQLKRRGIDPELAYSLLIAAIVGGVVGAKAHYLIVHPDQFSEAALSGSGLIWYGGLFGGAAACVLVAVLSKARTALVADAVAPALAAGYVVGRIGCLLNGDDYGVPTSLPWAMSFPKGSPPTDLLVHPTQIYESLMSLIIVGLLLWVLAPRLKRAGALFWSYVGLAGVERFIVEFVRTNDDVLLGLTQAQLISVVLVIAGVAGMWWLESRPAGHAAAPEIGRSGIAGVAKASGSRARGSRASGSKTGGSKASGAKGKKRPKRARG